MTFAESSVAERRLPNAILVSMIYAEPVKNRTVAATLDNYQIDSEWSDYFRIASNPLPAEKAAFIQQFCEGLRWVLWPYQAGMSTIHFPRDRASLVTSFEQTTPIDQKRRTLLEARGRLLEFAQSMQELRRTIVRTEALEEPLEEE